MIDKAIAKMTFVFQVIKYKKECSMQGLVRANTETCQLKKQGATWQG